jgi:hypothetical protein
MNKLVALLVLMSVIAVFSGSLYAASDIISVNFYHYGKSGSLNDTEKARLRVEGAEAAGVGDWNTTGWNNFLAVTGTYNISNSLGSTATCTVHRTRNASPYWWAQPRTTLLTDPDADLMDSGFSATEDSNLIFDMTVSSIPYPYYDVVLYFRINQAQYTPGTGKFVFNGGPEQSFTFPGNSEFSAFDDISDDGAGNYIVFEGVSGTSFTLQVWGDNFAHLGPAGFQFGVLDTGEPVVDAGSDWITWSGEDVTLDDVVVVNNDPGAGDVNLTWSAAPVPDVTVDFSDIHAQYPTVTITKSAPAASVTPVTLTLTGTQLGKNPVESSMTIDVYDNACDAGLGAGAIVIYPTDFNSNCTTDMEDLVQMTTAWLVEFSLTEPAIK